MSKCVIPSVIFRFQDRSPELFPLRLTESSIYNRQDHYAGKKGQWFATFIEKFAFWSLKLYQMSVSFRDLNKP